MGWTGGRRTFRAEDGRGPKRKVALEWEPILLASTRMTCGGFEDGVARYARGPSHGVRATQRMTASRDKKAFEAQAPHKGRRRGRLGSEALPHGR